MKKSCLRSVLQHRSCQESSLKSKYLLQSSFKFAKCLSAFAFLSCLFGLSANLAFAESLTLADSARSSLAVYEQGQFQVLSELSLVSQIRCGSVGDIPVPGNYLSDSAGNVAAFNPSFGLWQVCAEGLSLSRPWGMPGDIPVPGDYNGDGVTDFTVYRPGTAEWFMLYNSGGIADGSVETKVFGDPGDVPVPADYDADGITEIAVFQFDVNSGGTTWKWLEESGKSPVSVPFGLIGDVPVPADYNGDKQDQIAVWRPSNGTWYVRDAQGKTEQIQFGLAGDIPSPSDIDGDGSADLVIYRPGEAKWYVTASGGAKGSGVQVASVGGLGAKMANDSRAAIVDIPAPIDFDGDRRTDLSLIRAGEGERLSFLSHSGTVHPHPKPSVDLGKVGDFPVPGDFDGDGITDPGVVSTAGQFLEWHFLLSASQAQGRRELIVSYGLAGDQVLPADFDGDRKTDLAVVRTVVTNEGLQKLWIPNRSGLENVEPFLWGLDGDKTLTADIDGDQKSDAIVVRSVLLAPGQPQQLQWFIRTAAGEVLEAKLYGFAGDVPFAGDYNGDGKAEIGVIRIVNGFKMVLIDGLAPYYWGLAGDLSLGGDFGSGPGLETAVWRLLGGQGYFFVRTSGAAAFGIPFGVVGDVPLSLLGVAEIAATNSSSGDDDQDDDQDEQGGGSRLNCTTRTNVGAQEGGFVWKPVSEADRKLVVLFGASRAGSILRSALVESTPEQDVVLETLDYVGNTNGGRPTFRANRPGRDYPAGVILIRQSKDGSVHCIDVPNPGQRYD